MIKPYNFQSDIILNIRIAMLNRHKHILVQSPTGSGKTVIFSNIVYSANEKNTNCLIITDRMELLTGSEGTVEQFGINTSRILRGAKVPPNKTGHCIAMSQTLRRRIGNKAWIDFFNSFGIVIIDEAHVQEFNIYFEKKAFTNNPYILGFTATPKRLKKQRQLIQDYSILIQGLQIPELIARGFLVKDKYYAPRSFDTSGLKINSFGDFQESSMFKKYEKIITYKSVVDNWIKYANDTITLVFCVNIEHTIKTCIAFNKAGIKSKFVVSPLSKPIYDDKMTDEQFIRYQHKSALYELYIANMVKYSGNRFDVVQEWENGKFNILINTGIFTKGYDHRPIETIIVYRATTSETLWLQMVGRGSRTFEDKNYFNILDFGSNAERLGLYNQEREWNLNGNFSTAEGVAPVKECGIVRGKNKIDSNNNIGCGCLILASRQICNYCGYIFEQDIEEIEIDLIHIDYENEGGNYKGINFDRLERTAEERGYKFGWVINNVIAEGGAEALAAFQEYKKYKTEWLSRMKQHYGNALIKHDKKIQNDILQEQEQEKLLF